MLKIYKNYNKFVASSKKITYNLHFSLSGENLIIGVKTKDFDNTNTQTYTTNYAPTEVYNECDENHKPIVYGNGELSIPLYKNINFHNFFETTPTDANDRILLFLEMFYNGTIYTSLKELQLKNEASKFIEKSMLLQPILIYIPYKTSTWSECSIFADMEEDYSITCDDGIEILDWNDVQGIQEKVVKCLDFYVPKFTDMDSEEIDTYISLNNEPVLNLYAGISLNVYSNKGIPDNTSVIIGTGETIKNTIHVQDLKKGENIIVDFVQANGSNIDKKYITVI